MSNTTNFTTVSVTTLPATIMTTITAATTIFNNSDNSTTNATQLPPRRSTCPEDSSEEERIIKITAYSVILFVSLIGNILIAAVILSNKKMKKPTNYFILNMAISDLVIPTMVISRQIVVLYTQPKLDVVWLVEGTFGIVLCKMVHFFQDVTTAVSIFSMMLITMDRFIAVVYPMKHYVMSNTVCKVSIVTTWLLAMSIHAIYLYTYDLINIRGMNICYPLWDRLGKNVKVMFVRNYYLSLFFLLAVLPVIVMAVAYSIIIVSLKRQSIPLGDSFSDRQKRQRVEKERKILRMAIAIIVSFVILWVPYNVYIFMGLFVYHNEKTKPCFLIMFRFIGFFCAYANAAVNPCICFIFSQNYRQGFIQMLVKSGIVKNRSIRHENTQVSMTTTHNKAYEVDS